MLCGFMPIFENPHRLMMMNEDDDKWTNFRF